MADGQGRGGKSSGDASLAFLQNQIRSYPVLTVEQEKEITSRYFETKRKSDFDLLVNSNLRFVIQVAFSFKNYGLPMADVIQEGVIGLMKAIEKFDPRKDLRLVTYAVWWIRARISSHVIKDWSMVKIGTTQAERTLFFKLAAGRRDLADEDGLSATNDELAEYFNVPVKTVANMIGRMSGDGSLDIEVGEEENSQTFKDLVLDDRPGQEELLSSLSEERAVSIKVQQGLWRLSRVEADVIRCRYLTEPRLTLAQTAERHGFSRERARQLEVRAMKKLKLFLSTS